MAAATAVKPDPSETKTTHFRTQVVNGKPQIYFDEIIDEPPVKSQPKAKRNSRMINAARLPEQPKPKPTSQKPPAENFPAKQPKRTHKITVNKDDASVGVFMTMEEIAELVKAVKDTSKVANNSTMDNREIPPPPPPPVQQQFEPPPPPQQQQQFNDFSSTVVVPQLDLPQQLPPTMLLGPTSPREEALGMMADKKRKKWMRDKAEMDRMRLEVEYDQLKHQLTPAHQKASSSPERSTFPSDYSLIYKPSLPPTSKPTDYPQNDFFKTGLIEKKQQQWKQENAEKNPVWNPFGRPGAGAPNMNETDARISQPSSNTVMPYRPPDPSSVTSNIVVNDQIRIPAAMRTNLLLGDVRFEDDVKNAKEIERRQWRDDLQRQIEDNKRKKFVQQETERRHDFLQENVQPLIQEAASRHQQQKDPSPPPPPSLPSSNVLTTTNTNEKEPTKSHRHDSIVKQTYDKILEATELAKYEKKQQLIEKLKRNGHKTDLLAKTLPDMRTPIPDSTPKTMEKKQDLSPKKTNTTKVEPLHFNVVNEQQQSYRPNDGRRDEAVNTIDSTFRSDHGVQTDLRMIPQNHMFHFSREESDLPPQVPGHLLRDGKQNRKNVRIRSHEDNQRQRRSSATTIHLNNNSHDDGNASQLGTHRTHYGPNELVHRPLWNYQNSAHREFVPNSRRDPNFDKRPKPSERTTNNRQDDVQKKTAYNRWNSDSELQHQRKDRKFNTTNQPRSIIAKPHHQQQQDVNLPKQQNKEKTFVFAKTDDELNFNNVQSLDKYERFIPYTRTDEVLDPARAFSPLPQTRESSAPKQRLKVNTYDDHHRRPNVNVQPPPYHVPPSQQQHILQQLTAIKENLVRRQQEVATSMNAIPV